jgi:inosine-uridine nucleoside N-ribohydrolase
VIIDTDVGDDIDDAFALAVALSDPRLKVLGITTAWGDSITRTWLVRRLLATMGRQDVVVAAGPATTDLVPFTQKRWAMGATDRSPALDAIDYIEAEIRRRPGQITLIALAPLSNLAALLQRNSDVLQGLKRVIVMGGSVYAGYQRGGAIPVAEPSPEYNVVSAPLAFAALLQAGVPVTMFPLDATQLKFDEVRRDRLFAFGSPATDALTLLYHQWRLLNVWGQITPTLFDVVPVTWLLDSSTCPVKPMRIGVDPRGYTRPEAGPPNVDICLSLNETAAQQLIMQDLAPE